MQNNWFTFFKIVSIENSWKKIIVYLTDSKNNCISNRLKKRQEEEAERYKTDMTRKMEMLLKLREDIANNKVPWFYTNVLTFYLLFKFNIKVFSVSDFTVWCSYFLWIEQ